MGSIAVFFWFIQFEIDQNLQSFSWLLALKNTLCFLIFPLQHSLLARSPVKKWVQTHFHPLTERPLYVGTSGLAMLFVLWMWDPFGPYIYRAKNSLIFDLIFYAGLALIIASTISLDHGSMFGLKQGYAAWKEKPIRKTNLQTGGIYSLVRHPITTLLIIVLWAHETMTAGRLLFNILFSAYALLGTVFEEKDLIKNFGSSYLNYRKRVPAFLPSFRRIFT